MSRPPARPIISYTAPPAENSFTRILPKAKKYSPSVGSSHPDDPPTNFYIVLKGEVGVFTRRRVELIKKEAFYVSRILQSVGSEFMYAEEIRLYCKYTAKEAREIEFFENIDHIFEGKVHYKPEYLAKKLGGVSFDDLGEKKLLFNDMSILKYDLVCILKEGSIFGELALIYNQPRLATVVCLTKSEMCLMNQESFRKTLGTIQRQEDKVKIEFIEKEVLISREYAMLAHTIGINFTKRILKKGEKLLSQGEIPEKVYIIRDGQVRIWKMDETPKSKEKNHNNLNDLKRSMVRVPFSQKIRELAIVGRAQIVGEEGLFTGEARQYSAIADTESTVYEMNNERFLVVCENNFMIKNMMEELIDKKLKILKILEARAIKATKRFNILASNLLNQRGIATKPIQIHSERGTHTTSSTSKSTEKKSFEVLFNRTRIKALETGNRNKEESKDPKPGEELIDIDKAIISMKEDLDKARKQRKKMLIEKYQRRKPSDLQSIMSKAASKKSERSLQPNDGSPNNQSKEDINIFNIVKEYKALSVNVNSDLSNFKKSFSVLCQNNPVETPSPTVSQKLLRMRSQLHNSRVKVSGGYLGLHSRSRSTNTLMTQVCVTDRHQTSIQEYESSTASLQIMPAIRITSLKRLPKT